MALDVLKGKMLMSYIEFILLLIDAEMHE